MSNIVRAFNELFGNIDWKDGDKIRKVIAEEIPVKVAADRAYRNAIQNSDKQNARIEHDNALQRVIVDLLTDHTELFKQIPGQRGVQEVAWRHDFPGYVLTRRAAGVGLIASVSGVDGASSWPLRRIAPTLGCAGAETRDSLAVLRHG